MEYFVRVILTALSFHGEDKQHREHTTFKYVPAFNRTDAEHMAEMLNKTVHHHRANGTRYRRNHDVCACVFNGKDRVYLDLDTLAMIAKEYTMPAIAAE